jgi:hypothetical protein
MRIVNWREVNRWRYLPMHLLAALFWITVLLTPSWSWPGGVLVYVGVVILIRSLQASRAARGPYYE